MLIHVNLGQCDRLVHHIAGQRSGEENEKGAFKTKTHATHL